jgi:glucan phosphoethanolaminetransferase (alkaline phosphatase superfamily)
MYAEEVKKGILILASYIGVVFLSTLLWVLAISTFSSSSNPIWVVLVAILAIVILFVIWIYQLYDAYQAAVRYNANLGKNRPY